MLSFPDFWAATAAQAIATMVQNESFIITASYFVNEVVVCVGWEWRIEIERVYLGSDPGVGVWCDGGERKWAEVFEGGLNSLGEPDIFANVLIYSRKKFWKPAACSNGWSFHRKSGVLSKIVVNHWMVQLINGVMCSSRGWDMIEGWDAEPESLRSWVNFITAARETGIIQRLRLKRLVNDE